MAAYLKTLIDENGNIVYPQSKAEAVYMSDNATNVENALNTKMNKINNTTAQFVAKDKIKINDVVYTVEDGIIDTNTDVGAGFPFVQLDNVVYSCCFSPDGMIFVLGGQFAGMAKIYSVSGTTVTFVSNIYADAGTTKLNGQVYSSCFSPDGSKLVLGGYFTGYAKIYSVSGTTVTFVSNIYADAGTTNLNGSVRSACFSPDSSRLVLGGDFTGMAKIYSVAGTTVTFVSDIYADTGTTALSNTVYSSCFSPDGTRLVLGGWFAGKAKIYSVSGTTVTFVSDIYADAGTTALNGSVSASCFSPDGTRLVLVGAFAGRAKIYSVAGTNVSFKSNVYADVGTTALSNTVYSSCFSPDGTRLVLVGAFAGRAKIYSVAGTTITFVSDIYADAGTTALDNFVNAACFSPDGAKLIIGGAFAGRAKIYSVSGTAATFVSNLYADVPTTVLNNYVRVACFSPDGAKLIIGGQFAGYAKIYSVSGTTVTFVSDIYADTGTTSLNSGVISACFSPDGSKLVLVGAFAGYAKIYSVSGTTVTFVSNIYADTGTTSLNGPVYSSCFSSDGSKLVLVGSFIGMAKIYSVAGTTITFVSDIYADAGTTALDGFVNGACFSPDGAKLIIGGDFTGKAKIYSVSGTTVTFVSNIYADTGTTFLNNPVPSACFSPDGTRLVLGGYFTGRAKIYSVAGTTITFVSDIYADAGTTALDNFVNAACFSPDGAKLIIGGAFAGRAKIYSVAGTNVSFKSNVYADVGTTALSNTVYISCFSPDGSKLVLGGEFTGRVKIYSVSGTTVSYAPQKNYITPNSAYTFFDAFSESSYFVGVSESDTLIGGIGIGEMYFEGKKGLDSIPASNVTAGTLAGEVVANVAAVATLASKQLRNIYAGAADLTAGTSALPTGDIYICYE